MRILDRVLTPWLAAGLLLLFAVAVANGGLRVRVALPASALVLALFAWRTLPRLTSPSERRLAFVLFGVSILLQALPEIASPGSDMLYGIGFHASGVMWTWSFGLSLLSARRPGRPLFIEDHRAHQLLLVLLLMLAVGLVVAHFALRDRYAPVVDEVHYILQSKLLGQPGFMRSLEPSLAPFFNEFQSYILEGRLNGQYPPGWPLLLAVFNELGLRWFAPVCMGVLAVAGTYLLGVEVRSRTVGLTAAAMLATSAPLVYLSSMYYSNISALACSVVAAWLLLRAERQHSCTRPLLWALAGAVLGFATMIRPLTGVSLALSLWGWIFLRQRVHGWEFIRMSLALVLGAAAPLGFLLYYNNTVTGSPFTFGYDLAQRGLNELGFGRRGFILWGPEGEANEFQVSNFTPRVAASHFFSMARSFVFAPGFMLAPLLFFVLRAKIRLSWATVGVFLVLPAAHFFYFYRDPRFYSELLPFLLMGVAVLLENLAMQEGRLARHVLVFWILGSLVLTGDEIARRVRLFRQGALPFFRGVEQLQRDYGKVLVFVRDSTPELFGALAWFNVDSFPGDVIVARDLGARDAELMKRWPDHRPFRASYTNKKPSVAPLFNHGSP